MNNFIKTFILGLILLIGVGFFANPVKANDNFSLELVSDSWGVIFGGERKTAKLKIINNTGNLLDGEAIFSAWYEGEPFQGSLIAISSLFKLSDNRSEWVAGSIVFSDFEISKGETQTTLEVETHSALMPGNYIFTLLLKGTAETGETYPAEIINVGGGGGRYVFSTPTITTTDTDSEIEEEEIKDEDVSDDKDIVNVQDVVEDKEKEVLPEGETEEIIDKKEEEEPTKEEPIENEIVSDNVFQTSLASLSEWTTSNKSALLTIAIFFCLVGLVSIAIKKWRRLKQNKQ